MKTKTWFFTLFFLISLVIIPSSPAGDTEGNSDYLGLVTCTVFRVTETGVFPMHAASVSLEVAIRRACMTCLKEIRSSNESCELRQCSWKNYPLDVSAAEVCARLNHGDGDWLRDNPPNEK